MVRVTTLGSPPPISGTVDAIPLGPVYTLDCIVGAGSILVLPQAWEVAIDGLTWVPAMLVSWVFDLGI